MSAGGRREPHAGQAAVHDRVTIAGFQIACPPAAPTDPGAGLPRLVLVIDETPPAPAGSGRVGLRGATQRELDEILAQVRTRSAPVVGTYALCPDCRGADRDCATCSSFGFVITRPSATGQTIHSPGRRRSDADPS